MGRQFSVKFSYTPHISVFFKAWSNDGYNKRTESVKFVMMSTSLIKTERVDWLKKLMEHTLILHLGFWLLLTFVLAMLNHSESSFGTKLIIVFLSISFYAVIIYANLLYLFPKYLEDKKLGKHLIILMLFAALLTPIKTLVLYFVLSSEEKGFIIDNQYFNFLSTFFVGIASSIYYILNDWVKGQGEKQELTNKTLQSELNFLKSQINPHFLFNTLNSLYALTLKKSDLAPEIVLKLSEMMRYMLYECNEKSVYLYKEITYLNNYLELEKLRHGKKMNINLKINGDAGQKQIAPLIFIPFVENCFKHGLSHQITEGFVNININIMEEEITLHIENSKAPSVPGSGEKKSGGIGLVNVRRRLELLYPNYYELSVNDTPNTYQITLKLKQTT